VARVVTRVQALAGVQHITVTDKEIEVIYDPAVKNPNTIARVFYQRGLAVRWTQHDQVRRTVWRPASVADRVPHARRTIPSGG
jgi:hypothetical protein